MISGEIDADLSRETVKVIKALRKILKPILQKEFDKDYRYRYEVSMVNDIKIASDALIYLTLSRMEEKDRGDLTMVGKSPILKEIFNGDICSRLAAETLNSRITFEDVLYLSRGLLKIEKRPEDNIQSVIQSDKLKDKPELRLALELYLLRGKFLWVNNARSEFPDYIKDDNRRSLSKDANINCWEAVLYAMIKSGIVSKEDIKLYHEGGLKKTAKNLEGLFDFHKAERIFKNDETKEKWEEVLSKKSYLIMISRPSINGLDHDMLSVPYPQKNLLEMLISHNFDEKTLKVKLYSHWCNWTNYKLNTVRKTDFNNKLEKPENMELRIIPINKLAERIKNRYGLDNFESNISKSEQKIPGLEKN